MQENSNYSKLNMVGSDNLFTDSDSTGRGLRWPRIFGTKLPYEEIVWENRTAKITKGDGTIVFEQKDVEVPNFWSQTATDIVASKYFRGQLNTPDREFSAKQMIDRVAKTIGYWGLKDGYFASSEDCENFILDLTWILINQYAAFNSPVWFNVGVHEKPQCSACQPYRALVSTPRGFFKIGEIVENNLVGLPVYDSHGVTKVVAVKNNGIKRVLKIKLKNGSFIEVTGDHLVKAVYERRTKSDWFRADQLKNGMRLHLYPHRSISDNVGVSDYGYNFQFATVTGFASQTFKDLTVIKHDIASQIKISEAALAGWLQADGFVGKYDHGTNRSLTLEFLTVNEDEKNWVLAHLKNVFPDIHAKIRITRTKLGTPITRIRLYGKNLESFVNKYDLLNRRDNIRVPDILWKSGREAISAYLRSVFQAEGFVSIRKINGQEAGRLAIATISKNWMQDIQILLLGLDIYSRVKRKEEKRPNRMDLYELAISNGSEKKKFQEVIGFISNEKQTKLISSLTLRNQKNIGNLREEEIVSIDDMGEQIVYDIQTESGEYLSNNIAVHNCFILAVEDNMQSILDWYRDEGWIFKYGSGAGTNLSKLRSSREPLSKGGFSSGPVSFMKGADGVANSIRSGGTTRRAAKMVILNVDHPDIKNFIYCKKIIEDMTKALIRSGIKDSITADIFDPYTLLPYQNANNSVRVNDEFMRAVQADGYWNLKSITTGEAVETIKARELMDWVADATWHSADPGIQYDTTINEWHTCPNTGRINASNPCFTGDTLIYTDRGLIRFDELHHHFNSGEKIKVYTHDITNKNKPENTVSLTEPLRVTTTGINPVYKLTFSNGIEVKVTENHRFWTKKGWIKAKDLNKNDKVAVLDKDIDFYRSSLKINADLEKIYESGWGGRQTRQFKKINLPKVWTSPFAEYVGYMVGDGSLVEAKDAQHRLSTASVVFGSQEEADELLPRFESMIQLMNVQPQTVAIPNGTIQLRVNRTPFVRFMKEIGVKDERAHFKRVPPSIFQAPKHIIAGFLRGLFSADGCVYNGKNYRYVGLGSVSKEILLEAQQLLLSFGIQSKIYPINKEPKSTFSYIKKDGTIMRYDSKPAYDLRIAGPSILVFKEKIGFLLTSKQEKLDRVIKDHGFYKTNKKGQLRLKNIKFLGEELTYNLTEPKNHSYIVNGVIVANCSEYMHLDNSACNLASLNLLKFLKMGGKFDIDLFRKAVDTMITAMDIIVDNASYPTEKIGENARNYRELGLGYANLGATLMVLGLPYDSEKGRILAGQITSLMCGEAYRMSTTLSEIKGPFAGYELNRDPMLGVIAKHLGESEKLFETSEMLGIEDGDLHLASRLVWRDALDLGRKYGIRNSQATVLAPTGTIAFLMDCDTTGVEPELALVKYKKLVGGGTLKLVNNQIPLSLRRLGYSNEQIEDISKYLMDKETIEGAPHLKEEHVSVFDCSFKAQNGERSINYMGHIKMMSAAQPFISGAISKTVNLPAEATVDDIKNVFMEGWRLGLKAIAVYRDGSKSIQPLNTKKEENNALVEKVNGYTRIKLPDERPSITHKFNVGGFESYLTVGFYPDTMKPGETFLVAAKEGSTVSGLFNTIATLISMCLQSGIPLKTLVRKFKDVRFDPAGFTNNPEIPTAKSITDYVFRYLGMKYLKPEDKEELFGPDYTHNESVEVKETVHKSKSDSLLAELVSKQVVSIQINGNGKASSHTLITDAPACVQCGTLMVRAGSCYSCPNCFATTGVCN